MVRNFARDDFVLRFDIFGAYLLSESRGVTLNSPFVLREAAVFDIGGEICGGLLVPHVCLLGELLFILFNKVALSFVVDRGKRLLDGWR